MYRKGIFDEIFHSFVETRFDVINDIVNSIDFSKKVLTSKYYLTEYFVLNDLPLKSKIFKHYEKLLKVEFEKQKKGLRK